MKSSVMFTLLLSSAVALSACAEATPPASAEPAAAPHTQAPPTAALFNTPTREPASTSTGGLIPTATTQPSVWDVADRMLAECTGSGNHAEPSSSVQSEYLAQLRSRVHELHPEFDPETAGGVWVTSTYAVMADDGTNPNPFAFADSPLAGGPANLQSRVCEGYALAYDMSFEEKWDEDGVLIGKGVLFYEVGGDEPYVLDGEVREVHFVFPPASDP